MLYASPTRRSHGFSLIEATLLLVIIAVMASTKLPKMTGSRQSDTVTVAAIAGEFDSSVRLARAQWFSNGHRGAARIEGFADGEVWSGQHGWPISHHTAQPPSKVDALHCAKLWNGVMHNVDAPRASVDKHNPWQAFVDNTGACKYASSIADVPHTISYNARSGAVSYR